MTAPIYIADLRARIAMLEDALKGMIGYAQLYSNNADIPKVVQLSMREHWRLKEAIACFPEVDWKEYGLTSETADVPCRCPAGQCYKNLLDHHEHCRNDRAAFEAETHCEPLQAEKRAATSGSEESQIEDAGRPGPWVCDSCGQTNSSWSTECGRCHCQPAKTKGEAASG